MKLAGCGAVVTGGASGLGEAPARGLAAEGVKVAIFDLQEDQGGRVATEIGGVFCKADVPDAASLDALIVKAELALTAGIANAIRTVGRDRETGAPKPFPLAIFEKTIQINLIGTFRAIVKSATGMMSLDPLEGGERGAIVNTASVAAEDGQIGQAAYSASKGGVVGMTLPIARDLSGEGIRVNTILPGIFGTPLMLGLGDKVVESLSAAVPFPKRLGLPAEYASLAIEMCRNSYLNGEDVRLDGAIRMAPK